VLKELTHFRPRFNRHLFHSRVAYTGWSRMIALVNDVCSMSARCLLDRVNEVLSTRYPTMNSMVNINSASTSVE